MPVDFDNVDYVGYPAGGNSKGVSDKVAGCKDCEKEIFDLTTDIDFAPLSVELSLEDRKTLANTLLKLGYKKVNLGE